MQNQAVGQITYQNLLVGCRIPKDYFITKGKGQSDITIHAGSYHLALKDAGIEVCNIMTYSSILPAIASEIEKPLKLVHGSVMETILAAAHAEKGKNATAGIIYGWLYNKETKEKYGGLVCEYHGCLSEEGVKKQLKESLEELYTNGFSEEYTLQEIKTITESIIPEKKYGTAIVALCFTNYLHPLLTDS
jgi:arginine decarboxylase